MESIFLPATITFVAIYIVLWQLDIYKILGYHVLVDICVTITLATLFAGTYSGVMVAMLAGLMLSIALLITKWLIGYKRITHWHRMRPVWEMFDV